MRFLLYMRSAVRKGWDWFGKGEGRGEVHPDWRRAGWMVVLNCGFGPCRARETGEMSGAARGVAEAAVLRPVIV